MGASIFLLTVGLVSKDGFVYSVNAAEIISVPLRVWHTF